ncbi:MAG: hypothetical protein HOC31_00915, partial [Nitrosopumilus sp.]|nr:hypothetical protein [Nitrosopumilus sp.]MBT4535212.1 hypothetical protein [Nitrosopumilus sp.]
MDTSKRQTHVTKKDPTRSITYRLSEKLISELETEANQKGISQNVLVKQILEKYIQWDRFSQKMGLIPVPISMLQLFGDDLDGQDIDEIINLIFPTIK